MSTATLPSVARQHVAFHHSGVFDQGRGPRFSSRFASSGKKILVVTGMPVFRSGVFRDSMGYQHTWEPLHIGDMARNFGYLRDQHIFEDVPVRDGHPGWLVSGMQGNGLVVGWHTSISTDERESRHDGQLYTYLLADFEVLDQEAAANIESGLWRNVSSEVGTYLTNSEAEHWPVYQGVAYCDIPAVEGLKGFSKSTGTVSVFTEGESAVAGENNSNEGTAAPVVSQPTATGGTTEGAGGHPNSPDTNPNANTTQADENEPTGTAATETPPAGGQPTAATQVNAGEGQHSNPASLLAQPYIFTVGGHQTTDFAAVQAHITSLETAQHERQTEARREFVRGLAEGNAPKIMASKLDELTAYALSLDAAGFEAWQSTWDAIPSSSLFASHASGVSNPDGSSAPSELEALQSELERAEAIVAHNKSAGLKPDALAKTPSFQKATALREQIAALTPQN